MSDLVANGPDVLVESLVVAALWTSKASKGSVQWVSECSVLQIRAYRFRKLFAYFDRFVTFIYMMSAFFEEPSWCRTTIEGCSHHDLHDSNLPTFPFWAMNFLHMCCVGVFMFSAWLRHISLGVASKHTCSVSGSYVVLLVTLLDCTIAFFNVQGLLFWTSIQLSQLCRPVIFLNKNKRLRLTAWRVLWSFRSVVSVLFMLALCFSIFTWVGIELFDQTHEGYYFSSWMYAFSNVFILYTTANNPDVWIKAYDENCLSFIFFAAYLTVSLYVVNNLLLASVHNSYKEFLKSDLEAEKERAEVSLKNAFHIVADAKVDDKRVISLERWCLFFHCFCNPHDHTKEEDTFNISRAREVFDMLDCDRNNGIDENEFLHVLQVLIGHVNSPPIKRSFMGDDFDHDSFSGGHVPRTQPPPHSRDGIGKHIADSMRGKVFTAWKLKYDSIFDVLILIDLLQLIIIRIVYGSATWRIRRSVHGVDLFFAFFYTVDVSLKLFILGYERFSYSKHFLQNWYDLFAMYGLFILELVVCFMGRSTLAIEKCIIFIRISRVTRLLKCVDFMEHLITIYHRVIPAVWTMFLLLLVVYYMFLAIGVEMFGGLIRTSGPLHEKLVGSAFDSLSYYSLNFNDFYSGLVLLFCVMIVSNWFIIAEAFFIITSSRWSTLYFVMFYLVTNLCVLNLVIALVLDIYEALEKEMKDRQDTPTKIGEDEYRLISVSHLELMTLEEEICE